LERGWASAPMSWSPIISPWPCWAPDCCGWLVGFNAGSALGANGLAASALVVTNTSAAAGALTWLLSSWLKGKPSALGMVSGGIAGLVAITPAAGFVDVLGAW